MRAGGDEHKVEARTLKPVEMTAALSSGSAPLPSLPQPRPRASRLILGSAPSRFEATRQPSGPPTKAADLRPNPLTGTCSRELLLPEYSSAARLRDMLLRTLDWHAAAGSGGFYAA